MGETPATVLLSLSAGIALAAATGLRVFLPLAMLGIAARLEWIPLTDGFVWIASDLGLGVLAAATLVEVVAYYVPLLDNALDAVAGPLAMLAGITMVAAVVADLPPAIRWTIAIVAGGGAAALVQGLTTVGRLKSTALTAGVGNPVLATLELGGALALSVVAILVPLVAVALALLLIVVVVRAGRRFVARAA
jgi:hypothetical protein